MLGHFTFCTKNIHELYVIHETGLNEEQQQQIDDIAYQCPLSGGTAVYWARAMRSLYADDADYIDEEECETATPEVIGLQRKLPTGFMVYPNPSDKALQIQHSNTSSEMPATIQIYNSTGQLIYSQIITDVFSTLNTSSYPNGVYILHINNQVQSETQKFIIQH